jgi:hypothetical protein
MNMGRNAPDRKYSSQSGENSARQVLTVAASLIGRAAQDVSEIG